MDRVVCVSEGQAERVRQAGVAPERVTVIRNAIDAGRFADVDLRYCQQLQDFFPAPRRCIVGAAGRLSPEKGFELFVRAAERIAASDRSVGFVHFGGGPLREELARRVEAAGLHDQFVFAGHRPDLDQFLPFLDLMVLPSFTEGLPNVVLRPLPPQCRWWPPLSAALPRSWKTASAAIWCRPAMTRRWLVASSTPWSRTTADRRWAATAASARPPTLYLRLPGPRLLPAVRRVGARNGRGC